jgi:hypothetical protein
MEEWKGGEAARLETGGRLQASESESLRGKAPAGFAGGGGAEASDRNERQRG